jgi:hypothetical protein
VRSKDLFVAACAGGLGFLAVQGVLALWRDADMATVRVEASPPAPQRQSGASAPAIIEAESSPAASGRDLHAVYMALKDKPDGRARFQAFQAATACQRVFAGGGEQVRDWNDLEYQFRERMAEEAVADRENAALRQAAFGKLKAACGGFTRPNRMPTLAELQSLRRTAAAAGSVPAKVMSLVWDAATPASEREAMALVFSSGDAEAFAEALSVMPRFQWAFADARLRAADAQAFTVALEIAACRLGKPCDGGQPLTLGLCALSGDCVASVEKALLAAPGFDLKHEQEAVNELADRVMQAVNKRQSLEFDRK